MDSPSAPQIEARLERAVAGGVVLGRDAGGRVVLAEGGLPGERVTVALRDDRPRMAAGEVVEVLQTSPDRVEPPCAEVVRGCGGCDLQHASPGLQRAMKVEVVTDALRRLGGVRDVPVRVVEELDGEGYRTTLRLVVDEDGRLGFRRRRSHDPLAVARCLVAHPLLQPVLAEGRFDDAGEVLLRASVATGDVLAVADPTASGAVVPEGVRAVGQDELGSGTRVWLHEDVDGHRLRVSARSFFQSGPSTAAALGRAVARAVHGSDPGAHRFDPATDRFVDLYGGIGLFTVLLGARRSEVVERSASSVADARANTAALGAKVVKVAVERWHPSPADVVVADPSRDGLGTAGAAAVAATGAARVALVSCDPAALGRDVALLAGHGYACRGVELVDMFPHTHHVEVVTALEKTAAPEGVAGR